MQPEEQLLLCCARTCIDENIDQHIRENLARPLNWEYILDNALLHGITPLLFHNLREFAVEYDIPGDVMERLKRVHRETGIRNIQFYAELRKVLKKMQDEKMPVIILKGMAMAETIYNNMALRPMYDMDILVKAEDLQTVSKMLLNFGYRPSLKFPSESYANHHHLVPHVKRKEFFIIEIHHNIAQEPFMSKINPENLWESVQKVNIAGINSFMLSPENLIINLCLHMSDEIFVGRIKVLVDIAETIRHYQTRINWDSVIKKSNAWGAGTFVYCSLYLVDKMMGVPVPSYVLENLKMEPKLKSMEKLILREIIKRSVLKDHESIIPPAFITSLCEEFFYTSGIHTRLANLLILISGLAFKFTKRTARNSI